MNSEAQILFEEILIWDCLRRLCARFSRRSMRLFELDDVTRSPTITNRYDAGLQTAAIRQIRGSENRTAGFDTNFHPLSKHTAQRWMGIARTQLEGVCMPPVELVQVGDIYFVRDGHRRISVGRALGQNLIEAAVQVWEGDQRPTSPNDTVLNYQALPSQSKDYRRF
jgi:hypothetical protein